MPAAAAPATHRGATFHGFMTDSSPLGSEYYQCSEDRLFYVGPEPMSTVRGRMRMKKIPAARAIRKVCPQRDKSCRCETALTTRRSEDRISVRMRVVHILSAIVLAIAILMLAIILRP